MLEKMSECFEQSVTLENRINVCGIHSLRGILAESHKNVKVYYAGAASYRKAVMDNSVPNLRVMRLFEE